MGKSLKLNLSQARWTFFLLALLVLSQGCQSDDDSTYEPPSITGMYRALTVMSDIAVDLNKDGLTSTNLILEMPSWCFSYPSGALRISPTVNTIQYIQNISIYFPHPRSNNISTGSSDYIEDLLGNGGYNYTYDEKTKKIELTPANFESDERKEKLGKLNSLTVVGAKQIEASITKRYYDFHTKDWIRLNITVVYGKI